MVMAWNLVDALSEPVSSARRAFYPPLASIPPGRSVVRAVDPTQFQPADDRANENDPFFREPNDPVFLIGITPPAGGFTDEDGLPDPAIRLHAMAPGIVRFQPADGNMADRLVLEMPTFLSSFATVPWWDRWVEADCVPHQVIYENVDAHALQTLLAGLQPGQDHHGLHLPPEVEDEAQKADFTATFMAGSAAHFLTAEAGAVLGTAAPPISLPGEPGPFDARQLLLHARYAGHTDADPRPMNPREFLYLLFGKDSPEADAASPLAHPLLRKMDLDGHLQAGLETRTMRLRPPLRTYARVIWEADMERLHHSGDWAKASNVSARFYNSHQREGRRFNSGGYDQATCPPQPPGDPVGGCWKCNLFVFDVVLRAGFRVGVHPVGPNRWHYVSAGQATGRVDRAATAHDREPVQGQISAGAANPRVWAWKIERWLRTIAGATPTQLAPNLNRALNEEGRCLILSGSRAGGRAGHIVIVTSVHDQPVLVPPAQAGQGLSSIRIHTSEATRNGATIRPAPPDPSVEFGLAGGGGAADGTHNFVRLHVYELAPGQDPDTPGGLQDLNVRI
jgi:hypothetical protein